MAGLAGRFKVSPRADLDDARASLMNDAFCRSVAALIEEMKASPAALALLENIFPDGIKVCGEGGIECADDFADLFIRKSVRLSTCLTGEFIVVEVYPSDWYLEFVAAVAAIRDRCVFLSHGWPILSLVSRISSVTEAGEVSSLPGGGFSA